MTEASNILITGGAGSCGRYLAAWLLERGHSVRVVDKNVEPVRSISSDRFTVVQGGLEDRDVVKAAVEGVDAIIHLAWSFSEDPLEVLEQDLKGHIHLLEEAASRKVRHLIYTSTAVVYGKPRYSPVDEGHPLLVEEARKPLYGIAKAAAEKLCIMYGNAGKVPATVVRFWWAYGEEIGGKHLREMLKTASSGAPMEVPAGCGGSFLHMADLARGMEICLFRPEAFGRTFNFSTVYVTWEEVAKIICEVTGSRSEIRAIPKEAWTGAAFLADAWELSDAAARKLLGYRPAEASAAKASLKAAISVCWQAMQKKT